MPLGTTLCPTGCCLQAGTLIEFLTDHSPLLFCWLRKVYLRKLDSIVMYMLSYELYCKMHLLPGDNVWDILGLDQTFLIPYLPQVWIIIGINHSPIGERSLI